MASDGTTVTGSATAKDQVAPRATAERYAWYVLSVLVLVYVLNFIDRQIVTILAPFLKADLGLTDAQVGLLFGTAFALFYALFGLPLAKLADGWKIAHIIDTRRKEKCK